MVKGRLSRASSLFPTLHESWGIELRSLGLCGTCFYSVSHLGSFLSNPMLALILQIPLRSEDSSSTVHFAYLATKKQRERGSQWNKEQNSAGLLDAPQAHPHSTKKVFKTQRSSALPCSAFYDPCLIFRNAHSNHYQHAFVKSVNSLLS